MNELLSTIDKLNDIPNVSEEYVFNLVLKTNENSNFKLSSYDLSKLWNNSDAVKFCFANAKTANDFMTTPKQKNCEDINEPSTL